LVITSSTNRSTLGGYGSDYTNYAASGALVVVMIVSLACVIIFFACVNIILCVTVLCIVKYYSARRRSNLHHFVDGEETEVVGEETDGEMDEAGATVPYNNMEDLNSRESCTNNSLVEGEYMDPMAMLFLNSHKDYDEACYMSTEVNMIKNSAYSKTSNYKK